MNELTRGSYRNREEFGNDALGGFIEFDSDRRSWRWAAWRRAVGVGGTVTESADGLDRVAAIEALQHFFEEMAE